jgi:2-(1,2-epoxy-1,2-dihydrophenyl)acetyl-CoA isomerase
MSKSVLLDFDGDTGIARITFNRPEVLNAADVTLARGFLEAVRSLALQPGLRCVVLAGAGRAFMAGGDVASFAGSPDRAHNGVNALLDALNPAILALRDLDAPILAAVRGVAAGAGLSLALCADIVLADADARFVLAYERIGTVPDCGGSWFLTRKAGAGRASAMMMLSKSLSAVEAHEWGLVTEVSPADAFDAAIHETTRKLAVGPGLAHAAFRRLADAAQGAPLSTHLETERAAFLRLTATADFAEGTAAFLEKRSPRFKGN